jgi:Flp pilus assembly protein TadD
MDVLNAQRWEEALAHFDRVTEINPNSGEAWLRRGLSLVSLQRWSDAFVSLGKAEKLGQKEATQHLIYWRRKTGCS